MDVCIKTKLLRKNAGQADFIPAYATPGSAGMDLKACIDEAVVIKPGQIAKIPTGIAIQIPNSYIGGFVFPRSGLSSKHGISLINCVGVIDSDYTGEVVCPVVNHSDKEFIINPGDRIAQLVFMPVCNASLIQVEELQETERGSGGFGSTGLK
ncbi:MAG: deoxyuridine 5'-triphosphate nucleotidohydrolase [Clostridiales bacterium GWB2_37_7]|nr:MAG: deoxyuridine 5'-triphosphate nucleotidohydrolase [Clostridiales bacterium GWB2_37_7]